MRTFWLFLYLGLPTIAFPVARAAAPATDNVHAAEFFEKEIRPILVDRCQSCHGDKKISGGLRLTGRDALIKGGETGPAILPGKPEQSLLIHAIEYRGASKMPPKGKLSSAEIDKLKRWVALGAPWPEARKVVVNRPGHEFDISEAQRRWWAFQPLQLALPPSRSDKGSAIDRFIFAGLVEQGVSPAGPADRRVLIRRASFDLIGLPPTPDEVTAFLDDRSPDAFAKVVDRLLASPAYGQRWARHWLDVVRYADYHDGNPKARTASCEPLEAWRYRDWVVRAFNHDMPYDQFIRHQIAGDLLPNPDGSEFYADGLIATTFLTNGSWDRGDADKEKMVSDMVDDQIDTVGKAFLGLTLGCARCHDHKFDPVSQADYYAMAGIFYSTHILRDIGTKGGEYTLNRVPLATRDYLTRRDGQLRRIGELTKQLAALDKKSPKPTPDRLALAAEQDRLRGALLPEPPLAEAAQEGGTTGGLFPKIQDVPLHIRGSYTRLGPIVPRRLPAFFAGGRQPSISKGSGRRELADWVASRDNPLTARVIVNRVWQGHFGTGLVNTPNNFGMLSLAPSHPALLDWLANRFIDDGWSIKALHRRIMLSAVYQRSGAVTREKLTKDPDNRWLGRFAARRLEAEVIRDSLLSVAGRLDLASGGPALSDPNTTRRALYMQTARWDRSNFSTLFDAANPDTSEEKRNVSTVAPQALFLLNHDFVLAQAGHLAERLTREAPGGESARIQRAFQLLFARPATAEEVALARQLLARPGAGWRDLAHVLLCSNEMVYVD